MKQIVLIITTTAVLSMTAGHVQADDRGMRGFFSLLGAVAEAAAARQDHRSHRDAPVDYGYYDDGYGQAQPVSYAPEIFDLQGNWVMRDGKRNRFARTHEGYYVSPVGRGRGVHYVEIGDNLYQDANSSGTYEIVDWDYMIWRSNDRRNLEIELFRE